MYFLLPVLQVIQYYFFITTFVAVTGRCCAPTSCVQVMYMYLFPSLWCWNTGGLWREKKTLLICQPWNSVFSLKPFRERCSALYNSVKAPLLSCLQECQFCLHSKNKPKNYIFYKIRSSSTINPCLVFFACLCSWVIVNFHWRSWRVVSWAAWFEINVDLIVDLMQLIMISCIYIYQHVVVFST